MPSDSVGGVRPARRSVVVMPWAVSQIWLCDIGMRIFMTAGPIFSGLVDGASYGALVAADSRVRFSSGLGQLGGQA